MTPKQQAAALVAKADEDIHVLTALASDPLTTDAVWGFHAQQAVEKLLKAELAFRRIPFPFTHRLLELADLRWRMQDMRSIRVSSRCWI